MATGLTLRSATAIPGSARPAQRKPGIFSRILKALEEAQQLRAEREIARYIEAHGGTFTDQVEREIEQHIMPRH